FAYDDPPPRGRDYLSRRLDRRSGASRVRCPHPSTRGLWGVAPGAPLGGCDSTSGSQNRPAAKAAAAEKRSVRDKLFRAPVVMALRPLQIVVYRFDEVVARPADRFIRVAAVIIERRPRRLHLLKRLTFVDQRDYSLADDRDHVAIVHDVGLVAEPAVSRDDDRTALLVLARYRDIENQVETLDDAVDAAAALGVEPRVAIGIEDVAGADNVGA